MEMGFFCIKMLGNVCILVSGTLLGCSYSRHLQKRYEELHQWKQNIITIYGDISYGGTTFQEILGHVMKQNKGLFLDFFENVKVSMEQCQGKKLQEIWRQAVEIELEKSHLNQAEKEEIIGLGGNLGNVDKDQQLAFLQLHMERMDYLIGILEKEKEGKMKLYRMLGVLGSIFVIVLLI